MAYYVIIRGPLGVGKSAVSKRLARKLRAAYISVDRVLDDQGIWYAGRLSEFLRANDVVVRDARRFLEEDRPVIIDGNFYWKTQIQDLLRRLDFPRYVFTLNAPLEICIRRDRERASPHGRAAAREVYAKSTRFEYGIVWDATAPVGTVVRGILSRIARGGAREGAGGVGHRSQRPPPGPRESIEPGGSICEAVKDSPSASRRRRIAG